MIPDDRMSCLLFLWSMMLMVLIHSFAGTAVGGQARLRLATTTSTENSGLLAQLLPPFEKRFGIHLDVIAVGTGRALKLGENGDVDVVLVHAPNAEEAFVQSGFGVNRRAVMYNDFVLLGPLNDPVGVRGQSSAMQALRQVAARQVMFISRGDNSGTHQKERELWQHAGISAQEQPWYLEVGQGMGATLQIASDKQAYTLTDRGTYLAYRSKLDLRIVHADDPLYRNPYSVIAVNPQQHRHVQYVLAMAFIGWLTSAEGQQLIGSYRRHDQVLFRPLAIPIDKSR